MKIHRGRERNGIGVLEQWRIGVVQNWIGGLFDELRLFKILYSGEGHRMTEDGCLKTDV